MGGGTTDLAFEYTVAEGDSDTDGISIAENQLKFNGGTITDAAGNTATLTHTALAAQTNHKVDTTPSKSPKKETPTISSLTLTSTGPYRTGSSIEVTVSTSENITVTGTPTLTLIVGTKDRTANYNRGSESSALVFRYTVVADETDTDGVAVKLNSLALNGGTLKDSDDNALPLTHSAITNAGTSHVVDTTAPAVRANGLKITSTSGNNYYKQGAKLKATVTFKENVTVTGTPTLTLTIGSSSENASYASGSDSKTLVFEYTIAADDEDTDGVSIAANQLSSNGGTIKDAAGNAATLTHSALGTQADHKIDGIVPAVAATNGLAITSTGAPYSVDEKVQATVTFSESVTVTGTPQLTLKIGDSEKTANYTSGSGSKKLIFEYTVAAGDSDTDGIEIEKDKLANNGGSTLKDVAGNAATLTHAALTTQTSHKVDTTKPTVSSVAIKSPTTNDYYQVNDKIQATVTFSESVKVTGTPQLTLKIDSGDKTANYTSGSGTTKLVFEYTVASDDADTDGIEIEKDKLKNNGSSTLKDLAGNDATLTHTAITTNHKIEKTSTGLDGTAPTVSSVGITSKPSTNGTYKTGETIKATVTFSEKVMVTGTPQLTLKIGNADKIAAYTSGSGSTKLVFGYTVISGDVDTDGIEIEKDKLANSGGSTIKDAAGNAAELDHDAVPAQGEGVSGQGALATEGAFGIQGFAALQAAQSSHKVDGVAPSISKIAITSTATTNSYYQEGHTIQVTVTFSENVYVTNTPFLQLKVGSDTNTIATYKSGDGTTNGSGTKKLVFEYTVAAGDMDPNGISIGQDALSGTIKDHAGNDADLTSTSLSTQPAHKVDTIAPSINGIAITSTPGSDQTYGVGEKIQARVTFSESVKVTGTPQLTLKIGTAYKNAAYTAGRDTASLVFDYTVATGDVDTDGISIDAHQLSGTITDVASNPGDLTNTTLTTQATHKVDAAPNTPITDIVPPTISSLAITSTAGSNHTYTFGEAVQITVTFSETVTVTGTPQLTLKIGTAYKDASYTNGSGTSKLVFEYTIATGDADTDGISIDSHQLSGTITDVAGNPGDLTNTTLTTQPTHKVDAAPQTLVVPPTISSLAISSTGPYGVWETIEITMTTTTPVMVTGGATLTIVIGSSEKRASYQSGTGTNALVFGYTVASGDGDDPNGITVKANSLSVNGGTIRDAHDTDLELSHDALRDTGSQHAVDTTAPKVSSIAFSSTGPYGIGSTIQVTLTTNEAVTVEGRPTLTLLIGSTERLAHFYNGTGTTSLSFYYQVNTTDKDDTNGVSVKANSLALNGGTMTDSVGNAFILNHNSVANGGDTQRVGTTISSVKSVAFTSTGPYSVDDVIKVQVTTSEKVTVTGIPRIALTVGSTTRYAAYASGSKTTTLAFQYTVVAGDTDNDGVEIPENALENNSSIVMNDHRIPLHLSHPSVAADTKHTVDTTEPEVQEIAFAPNAPTVYTAGSTLEVIVTFEEADVQMVPGTSGDMPSLTLLFGENSARDSQKTALKAEYKETRAGSTKFVFTYAITSETPVDMDGVQIESRSLRLPPGAAITDIAGNAIKTTPDKDGGSIVAIRPSSRVSSSPILPAVATKGVVFNEFLNAKTDKEDWVELRNVTSSDISLSGWTLSLSTGNGTRTDTLELPDIKFSAGAILLLMNSAHKDNRLEYSKAYTYRYLILPKLHLSGAGFSLILRDRSGSVVDMLSEHSTFEQDEAYVRKQLSLPGYDSAAWEQSGYQAGLGYDRNTAKALSSGTPGYLQTALTQESQIPTVSISEIMFAVGDTSERLPQWIELYNASKTEVASLQGWRFEVEIYDPAGEATHRFGTLIIQRNLRILPNQTVLVVTKKGRNSGHFPEQRVYNLTEQNADRIDTFGPEVQLAGDIGFAVVLRDDTGNQVDIIGNLDGENSTRDEPRWKLLNSLTDTGHRTSIVRQYEDGLPLTGTRKSSWFRAVTMGRTAIRTYWGHPRDVGNPGWKKGGALPVQLSSFQAERTDQGARIKWTTESSLENAGFNVLRSDTKTGTFKVINPRMLEGAGTTSERNTYTYVDTTAKAGVAYYYRLEEVSFSGLHQPIATRRLRGHVSAANRYLTTLGHIKRME